jgi:starch phosphorylase
VKTFQVRASLPERLAALDEVAYNLRWSWDHESISLFRRLDPELWERTGHNPVHLLGSVSQERLHEVANDEAFLAHLDRVKRDLDAYVGGNGTWYAKQHGAADRPLVAYFSMEFGLTECLPNYSGGLGMLAGDHLKSASELGIPLVGVGLLYQKGYFRQYLSPEGWQQERYPVNDFHNMPLRMVRDDRGQPLRIPLLLGDRTVQIQLWKVQVGRVPVVLLDTNLPENPPDLQDVTDGLYGGDMETRIRQEVVLGIGGMRALHAVGMAARVYHMNEGHSAFVGLERIRRMKVEKGLTLPEAWEIVSATTVFTTHTPVPAGIDVFPRDVVERYLDPYLSEIGGNREELLDQGRVHRGNRNEPLNMAVVAIRLSGFVNAVSRLHRQVARAMWREVWPGIPVDEVPIRHVTNGVHPSSWISEDMRKLYDRYLGPRWAEEPGDTRVWQSVHKIPGEELWRTHERHRERLVAFARSRLVEQLRRRGAGPTALARAEEILDPEALTIGFARRFATYKRATLLLRDPERLARLLNDPDRPVQIIFAGKAHPKDDHGKSLIREIVHLADRPEFRRRIVFVEDFDMVVAKHLVQGCDVWLNTPRRPREASGTSGMKAAFNGVLNLSILDGWWDEGYSPRAGWAIGAGEEYPDLDYQDRVEAGALYDIIEREVVELFYSRSSDGLPRGWISMMKSAMQELCPVFNTNRMVHQYLVEAYIPARERRELLEADGHKRARSLSRWRRKVHRGWANVRVLGAETELPAELRVGDSFRVRARVQAGSLAPDDLNVQVYLGTLDERHEILSDMVVSMAFESKLEDGSCQFAADVPCTTSGMKGFTIRVIPHHADLGHQHGSGLIHWAT